MVLLEDTIASCKIIVIIFYYFSALSIPDSLLSLTLPSLSSLCSDSVPLFLCHLNLSLSLPTLFVSISLSFLSLSNWHINNVYGGGIEIGLCGGGVEIMESCGCVWVMVVLFMGHDGCCDSGLCSWLGYCWLWQK